MELEEIGFDKEFREKAVKFKDSGFVPARIIAEHKERYIALAQCGEVSAEVTGKFMHTAGGPADYPKTGDWVMADVFPDEKKAYIHEILERKTVFSRKAAGAVYEEQVIAANIDCAFIVQGLDDNFNPSRLTRYAFAVPGNIKKVIVLNKEDVCENTEDKISQAATAAKETEILAISALTGAGFDELGRRLIPSKTYAFLGSSGAGKSSIINRLAGRELAQVNEVRDKDSKGRHTTTARELFILESGALLIDTPGMREFGLWPETGAGTGFDDIDSLAINCKFADCSHENEPGCAVLEAVKSGEFEQKRLEQYYKLKKESFHALAKIEQKTAIEKKQRQRQFGKMVKNVKKLKKGRKGY